MKFKKRKKLAKMKSYKIKKTGFNFENLKTQKKMRKTECKIEKRLKEVTK